MLPTTRSARRAYDRAMPYRRGKTSPWHGSGHFDDPFMIPEPAPIGEGPSQRRTAVIALAIGVGVVVAIALAVKLLA